MVGGEVGVRPADSLRFAVRTDVLSGDDDPADDRATAFNTVYGANHKFYGHMDMAMFLAGGFRDGQGLVDSVLRGRWSSGPTSILVDQHLFLLPVPSDEALLAVEPNLQLRQKLTEGLVLQLGTNMWFPLQEAGATEFMTWMQIDARM